MCDYSLMHVASRPAQVGDKLVSTRFHNSISRGFAASGEPNVAVCVLPGTEIAFDEDVRTDNFPTDEVTTHGSRVALPPRRQGPASICIMMRWNSPTGASCC